MDKLPYKWEQLCDDGRVLVNDNIKCRICKKPTNVMDCVCYTFNKMLEDMGEEKVTGLTKRRVTFWTKVLK